MNGASASPLARVCLAISSFRHDDAVERLLSRALARGHNPFASIIVVDSLGTGRIPALLEARAWPRVAYHSHPTNLGSAGNLAERLRLAAASDADHVYAVNHDASLDLEVIRALAEHARQIDQLGALYPLKRMLNHGGKLDITGTSRLPLPFFGARAARTLPPLLPVQWSSSNGALYALAPVRAGLGPPGDFWLGWEDLAYGWQLEAHGYRQYIASQVVLDDDYEYRQVRVGPWRLRISDKPSWYAYYQFRNLLLAARRQRRDPATAGVIAGRVALELGLTALFRAQKRKRLYNIACGLVDGLRGRTGKWVLP
jgi:GT2 family glycosyltransferase